MTQDEKRMTNCNEVLHIIETNHRNPSKYDVSKELLRIKNL